MQTELDRIEQHTAFVVEINALAGAIKSETQMDARGSRVGIGAEDQMLAGFNRRGPGREDKLCRAVRIVGYAYAGQIKRSRPIVVQLYQVRECPLVFDGRNIDCQHFIDKQLSMRDIDGPGA